VFDHKEKKNIIKRLNYIKGQIEGVEKMIEKGREYKEVFIQLKAVEGALNKLIYTVFAETLKKQLAEALSQRLMECPGNCELAEYPQFLRKEFGKLNIEEIIQAIDKLSVKQKRRQKP
jgi:DNA-binding FrmR family transcriptional regulator